MLPSPPRAHVRRVMRASPAEVFAAWTEPAEMAHWMTPLGTATAEVDLRVAGRFRLVMADEHLSIEHTGEYRTARATRWLRLRQTRTTRRSGTTTSSGALANAAARQSRLADRVRGAVPRPATGLHLRGAGDRAYEAAQVRRATNRNLALLKLVLEARPPD